MGTYQRFNLSISDRSGKGALSEEEVKQIVMQFRHTSEDAEYYLDAENDGSSSSRNGGWDNMEKELAQLSKQYPHALFEMHVYDEGTADEINQWNVYALDGKIQTCDVIHSFEKFDERKLHLPEDKQPQVEPLEDADELDIELTQIHTRALNSINTLYRSEILKPNEWLKFPEKFQPLYSDGADYSITAVRINTQEAEPFTEIMQDEEEGPEDDTQQIPADTAIVIAVLRAMQQTVAMRKEKAVKQFANQ